MRLAVFLPRTAPESFHRYVENVARNLRPLGCETRIFVDLSQLPREVDLLWDPRAGGGHAPPEELCFREIPLVVTVHGVAPMAIPATEYFRNWRGCIKGWRSNFRKRQRWRALAGGYEAVIAVSEYSRRTVIQHLPIPADRVYACPHGVENSLFTPGKAFDRKQYFLHVSNDEPRKNVDRICEAYLALPRESRPKLLLKLGRSTRRASGNGIEVVTDRLSDEQLVELYQNAFAFVFPSLYEGFGLPILEAMSCGCAVVTANENACIEVAGNAALTVDPRSVRQIRDAMLLLVEDRNRRDELVGLGFQRTKQFTWESSARRHMSIFENVIGFARAGASHEP